MNAHKNQSRRRIHRHSRADAARLRLGTAKYTYTKGLRHGRHEKHDAEDRRLAEDARREQNWKRWGPYLSERQWGTVREDYSADGSCWEYFPHDHARSRAYRWGEDGLLGITDRECRLCFALALWNGRDPFLKERLFGLTNAEGNHGEDVKECYFYLDATPTSSYLKALYKYPQAEFPYARLLDENQPARDATSPSSNCSTRGFSTTIATSTFSSNMPRHRPTTCSMRITAANRGPDAAALHLLPTLWFRNTWIWGCTHEGCWIKPRIASSRSRERYRANTKRWAASNSAQGPGPDGQVPHAAVHRERDEF